jgi:hypothetical protein
VCGRPKGKLEQRGCTFRPSPNLTFRNYDASIDVRIVVDPATLLAYQREERIYWYASFGKEAAETVLESDHLLSTSSYRAP